MPLAAQPAPSTVPLLLWYGKSRANFARRLLGIHCAVISGLECGLLHLTGHDGGLPTCWLQNPRQRRKLFDFGLLSKGACDETHWLLSKSLSGLSISIFTVRASESSRGTVSSWCGWPFPQMCSHTYPKLFGELSPISLWKHASVRSTLAICYSVVSV
jgi:hypothetical protein